LDLDPAFTQLWQASEGIDMGLDVHDRHVTVGLAIGDASCDVPTLGIDWITTPQPVVLEEWPVGEEIELAGLTTVGNWRGYGSVEWQGVMYGQRAHSFRTLMHLPRLTGEPLMPALSIHPEERADVRALEDNGWRLLDPAEVASTPERYRSFVRGSKGELGVAKSGYVLSRSGWFSDRSACYLAAGRPVIAQDTGFSSFLPTGAGLMAFDTAEDAAARIDDLNARYEEHRAAARALAEDVFDSRIVLARLLERLGEGP
ncbi:MAG: glycosyltransferase, partial [Actinomycetota bacterium]